MAARLLHSDCNRVKVHCIYLIPKLNTCNELVIFNSRIKSVVYFEADVV